MLTVGNHHLLSDAEKNVKNLPAGKYWVRIGVRTNNPGKKYNFSRILEVVIPDLNS